MRFGMFARCGLVVLVLLTILPGSALAQGGTYVVQRGDTLASIATQYGTTVPALMRANGLSNPNFIWAGQKLLVSGGNASGGGSGSSGVGSRYVVQAGDTLSRIATRFGTSSAAIARANGITNPNLVYAGMVLSIPGGGVGNAAGSGGDGLRFVASISQQHCWLYRGDALLYSWVCSTGRQGAPSYPGTYSVRSKYGRAYGATWNIWMPYWLGIYTAGSLENGIHGLPYNATSGAQLWAGNVGAPITYGCIMLDDAQAKALWDLAYIGIPVVIQP